MLLCPGSAVRPEDLTPEVWDYIFLEGPQPKDTSIAPDILHAMRREFHFWYPFDLRVRPSKFLRFKIG